MKILAILMLLGLSPLLINAQTAQTFSVDQGKANLKVTGTSTLHDWEMNSEKLAGSAQFEVSDKTITAVRGLTFTVPAGSLKSEKSGMDKNAYKALQTEKFPTISFKLTRVIDIKQAGDAYQITAEGNLQIAGQTKLVQITAACTPQADGIIVCKGEKELNMKDYQVEPPSFMFGSVKTGAVVNVIFNLVFSTENQTTKK